MQLKIQILPNKPIKLPINYNHILQAVIYNAVSSNSLEHAESLHEEGARFENRKFKQFTFGPLKGHYSIKDKMITFDKDVVWEIRSCDVALITIIERQFRDNGITILSNKINDVRVNEHNLTVNRDKVQIVVRSPIIAYSTQPDDHYTHYYTPEERGFYELTKINAYKRYIAIMKSDPGQIEFKPISVRRSDRIVTKYRGTVLSGWKGKYELTGDPHLIDFLYQTGLGAKNSGGFGMFDIVPERL